MGNGRAQSGMWRGVIFATAALLAPPALEALESVGLSAVRAQRFGRPSLPNPNPDGGDGFGQAFGAGDFNGDGAEDLATGVPGSDGSSSSPLNSCGAVIVRYGEPGSGLAEGGTPTVLGQFVGPFNLAEANSQFGAALAVCNLNGDAYDDLVVGVPFRTVSVSLLNFPNAGVLEVYYGSSAGIVPPASTSRRERGQDVNLPTPEAHFGAALACADFDADGFDDVAVGLPYRSLGTGAEFAGRINVFSGSASGLSAGALALDQNSSGMVDTPEFIDNFGAVLATGDFDQDGFADLAIGVAGETHSSTPSLHSGAVQVVYGGAKGLGTGFNEIIFESDLGRPNLENQFGRALAAGSFDGDADDDLVIGIPGENLGPVTSAGAFFIIQGTALGLATAQADLYSDEVIFPGAVPHANDVLASALAAGDFDGDGAADLAIGKPGADFSGIDDGAVVIVMGEAAVGIPQGQGRRRQVFHGHGGFPGDPLEQFVAFGDRLGVGDFDGNGVADLAIGAPRENESLLPNVGTATVLYGALFADGFDSGFVGNWSTSVP